MQGHTMTHVAAMALGLYSHIFCFSGVILAVNLHGTLICLLRQNRINHLEHSITRVNIGSC